MRRITTPTRAQNKFGAGKDGFRDGDLASGVYPTDLNADWFDQVQEEIARVIEAAGLTLDGTNLGQLLLALSRPGVFTTPGATDNSTRAATTAFVRSLFPASFSGSAGYIGFPGGYLLQMGRVTIPTLTAATWTFPVAFPNQCIARWGLSLTTSNEVIFSPTEPTTESMVIDSYPGVVLIDCQVFAFGK